MKQRDQAYLSTIRLLVEGHLAPGQFVTQRELADLTGMTLGAVREMIPRLEADGLIRAIAQRGLQIASFDIRSVHEAHQLREIIECAGLVQYLRTASDEAIAAHRAAHERIAAAARKSITKALVADAQAVDWALHEAFSEAIGNRLIAEIQRVNTVRIRMIMQERVTPSPATLPAAWREHMRIVDALARRDEVAALAALRAHLATARRLALSLDGDDELYPLAAVGV
jgi:DNA-binding GntR family transcriptional regulator